MAWILDMHVLLSGQHTLSWSLQQQKRYPTTCQHPSLPYETG